MDALIDAIDALATTMRGLVGGCSETEAQILNLLESLRTTAQNKTNVAPLAPDMDRLHHIWTHSIDWCSDLSRQLEKIIILYQEAIQTAPKTPSSN